MRGHNDKPEVARVWGIFFALALIMLATLVGLLFWAAISAIDWNAVLRFIAPTAFDPRSIEDILEGGQR